MSEVRQQSIRYTLRLNYHITPDLTLQYYGQPFITRPIYSKFGYVKDPLNNNYDARFHTYTSAQIKNQGDGYAVDENQDGQIDYTFSDPNFNFIHFRSNLAARWEYKPGSELYLVWSQNNNPEASTEFDTGLNSSLFNHVFDNGGRNIFLVKATYRLVR